MLRLSSLLCRSHSPFFCTHLIKWLPTQSSEITVKARIVNRLIFHKILVVRLTEYKILYIFKWMDLTAQVAFVTTLTVFLRGTGKMQKFLN